MVHELSGGEQQRVGIARALANEPFVLLADEPSGNLDERASRGIMELFRVLNAQGMAILMATHDLELVRAYPDIRVLELNEGRLVYDSPPWPLKVAEGLMYTIREALAGIRRAPFLTTLSAAMVALALLVVGLFTVVSYNLHQALIRVEERVEVVVYLRDDVRNEEVQVADEILRAMPEVAGVRYVSKEEALRVAQEELPEFRQVFVGLDVNPLPASLEVELLPGYRTPDAVERVSGATVDFPFVEDVVYGSDWVDRVYLLRSVGAVATTILGTAFAVVAALIIGTAGRIAIFARKDEIQIMRLVGATRGFIRRPFLLEGFLTGLVGGILALGLTYSAYVTGSELIFPLAWIPGRWVLLGILAGGLFGVVSSAFAIRKYLREV